MPVQDNLFPLNKTQFDIKSFDCGKEGMNHFLSRFAAKHMVLGVSSTFVVPGDEHKKGVKTPIAAYFTFTYSTVKREEIPTDKNFPPYELPVFLLARLAVDKTHARKGLGEKVLVRALRYAIELQERGLPGVAVVLDVLDEDALGFYEKFDFLPFHDNPMRLYMPMKTVLQLK